MNLRNVTVLRCLADAPPGEGETARADLVIEAGRIAAILPPHSGPGQDQDGGMVWPCFVDVHTHLDKGHIVPRAPNPDGTFAGALAAVAADREARWTAEDVRARAVFGLRCAWAHGTRAIRTHLDSIGGQADISWGVFRDLRDEWSGRIALQGVSLFGIESARDAGWLERLGDLVARSGGVMGGVTFMVPDLDALLDRVFAVAEARGLDLDFHVDESGDANAASLERIAATALRRGFPGRILVGHCCSLSRQSPEVATRAIAMVAEAGIAVVSLPMCNMYLQDRALGRTPRWRGITLLHELRAAGVPVCVASDNCRDPFYAYGDHDVMEVFREAARIAHFDHPFGDWPRAVTVTPAEVAGLPPARIAVGAPADLVLFRASRLPDLLARPTADRTVLRAGEPLNDTPPDYRELERLYE
jgi:cytosine deaminase